jgi:hypothetical protein
VQRSTAFIERRRNLVLFEHCHGAVGVLVVSVDDALDDLAPEFRLAT